MKRNILLIVVDCLGSKHLDRLLSSGQLPYFQKIISEGVYFPQTITTSTHTTPSFASMLSGLYPTHHGVWDLRGFKINPSISMLQEILKNNGYDTHAWVTGPLVPSIGLDKGWNSYSYRNQDQYILPESGRTYLNKLQNMKNTNPWFILFHLWELHAPRRIHHDKQPVNNLYDKSLIYLEDVLREILDKIDLGNTDVIITGDHGQNINICDYLGILDKCRFVYNGLKSRKPLSFYRNSHGFHLYEDIINVPLIFIGADFPKARTINKQVSTIDIFSTVLSVTGAGKDKHDNKGTNLLSIAANDNSYNQTSCFVFAGHKEDKWPEIHCARNFPWKYFRIYDNNGQTIKKEVLINLQSDYNESHNCKNRFSEQYIQLKNDLERLLKDGETFTKGTYQRLSEQENMAVTEKLRDLGYL